MYGIKEHHYSGVETMFGFMRKKKQDSLPELPPPPSPLEFPMPTGDIPSIRAPETMDAPELPSFEPEEEKPIELPEAPSPEMPELPEPSTLPEIEPHEIPELPPMDSDTGHVEPLVPETFEEPSEKYEEPAEIPERETIRESIGPTFVSVDDYRNIMDSSNRVRAKLDETDEFVKRLAEIKSEEEKTFGKWRSQLEEIERKLGQIDKVIAKAKR
jgi:hypothetical protein